MFSLETVICFLLSDCLQCLYRVIGQNQLAVLRKNGFRAGM